jgi:hypothetical protein
MIRVSEKEVSVVTIKLDSDTALILYSVLGKLSGSGKSLGKMEKLEEELSDHVMDYSFDKDYTLSGEISFKEGNDE